MSDELERMHNGQKAQLRASALRVRKLYPGPAGEILAKHIDEWEEFGYRFDAQGLMAKLVKQIWSTTLPDESVVPKMGWEPL